LKDLIQSTRDEGAAKAGRGKHKARV
jgi:hypothetical protein